MSDKMREALEKARELDWSVDPGMSSLLAEVDAALAPSRPVTEGAENPVLWIHLVGEQQFIRCWTADAARAAKFEAEGIVMTPLYAAPPAAAGREEAIRLLKKISDLAYDEDVGEPLDDAIGYANKALAALAVTPHEPCAVRLGDAVYVNDLSPYAHDWRGADWLRVVSLRVDPDGKEWASVTEGNQPHRGYGIYDGETDGFEADHLSPLPRAERGTGS